MKCSAVFESIREPRPMSSRSAFAVSALAVLLLAPSVAARAEEEPVFRIEMADGTLTPARLEVPAGKAFKLQVTNSGTAPAEFESRTLRKEKVIAPKATVTLSVKKLAAGDYDFFDENQPKAPAGVIVAK